ncbi:MAG TPA: DUF3085 domain-containing protein [Alphaproteobacteria bacterium]|nr:DUF3085 domain-containing protein [Alphaproteobacteria bacterium]
MTRLVFDNGEALRRLAIGTMKAEKFRIPYTDQDTSDKGVLLVKDEGIYLMNAYAGGKPPNELGTVVFAESYDPTKDEDVWERSRQAVGGDDFGEFVPLPEIVLRAIVMRQLKKLIVYMGEESYSVEFE